MKHQSDNPMGREPATDGAHLNGESQITPNQTVHDLARSTERAVEDLSPQLKDSGGRMANASVRTLNQIVLILHELAWQLGREAFIAGSSPSYTQSGIASSIKGDAAGDPDGIPCSHMRTEQ